MNVEQVDSAAGEASIQKVMSAVNSVSERAAQLLTVAAANRGGWNGREGDFDILMAGIGKLEEANHPKASTLRKLGDAIRQCVNANAYQDSIAALDQLRPKYDQIYQQHQQDANNAATVVGVPNKNDTALGGVISRCQEPCFAKNGNPDTFTEPAESLRSPVVRD